MTTATLHHVRIPFRKPFGHAIATREHAEALVLVVESGGVTGVGECVPRPYVTGETFATAWDAIVRQDLTRLVELVASDSPAALARSVEALALPARLGGEVRGLAAGCAVELALLDLHCVARGWRLGELAHAMGLPAELLASPDETLAETISVPLDFRSTPADLAHLVGSRLGHLKVKVGADLATDLDRVRECRARFGPAMSLSIDANMAWSLDDALRAADAFRPFDVAWYEEPLAAGDRHHYRALRDRGGVAVMLDEAACDFAETAAAIDDGRCDLINIRISKCGGFLASLRLAELARRRGVRFQHGAQVGQLGFLNAAGRHFTSLVRGIVACEGGPGLANLTDQPTRTPVRLDWEVGHLVGLAGPGLGVRPDLDKLRRYATRIATWSRDGWRTQSTRAVPGPEEHLR